MNNILIYINKKTIFYFFMSEVSYNQVSYNCCVINKHVEITYVKIILFYYFDILNYTYYQ